MTTNRKIALEVITLPVADVDRSLRFYVDQVGFVLDVDYAPTDAFRVVQLTPPGSSCSIQIGTGITDAPADPDRGDYASFAGFADPDGNTWVLQERADS